MFPIIYKLLMFNSLAYTLQTCFLNLFLNKGTMFAPFHSKGTIPSCSDMLKACRSGILICSTVSGTGIEQVSSPVNTELKCIFYSSPIKNHCVIIFPALSSSGPTVSRTFCLLLTYAWKLLLSDFVLICAQNFA